MRLKKKCMIAAGLALCVLFAACGTWQLTRASAETGNVWEQTAGEKFSSDGYLPFYALPADAFTYTCNDPKGEGQLALAFDGNFATQWTSATSNGDRAKDPSAFVNTVTVSFRTPVTIEGVLYQASDARVAHGYPQELEIRCTGESGAVSSTTYASAPTVNRVVFRLEKQTVTKLEFLFLQPNKAHNWVAAAKEIEFLLPQSDDLDLLGSGSLFADYTQTTLREGTTAERIAALRTALSEVPTYESAVKGTLDRAQSILDGAVAKDPAREFSTAERGENTIARYGNIRNYCSSVLKMSTFGVDYQPTGVALAAGSTLTVYVEAEKTDPLPSVMLTQTFNIWEKWNVQIKLSRGKNVIVAPNFLTGNEAKYTTQPEGGLSAGGAVYLVNPYTPSEQSEGVKVYLEGGVRYPLFREGGDEDAFRAAIADYAERMAASPAEYPDVAELVSDHILASSLVSSARTLFLEEGRSPAESAKGWDAYMEELFTFGGVSMDPADPHYDPIRAHLRHNCRIAQPWAGALAYAAGGFCGFCTSSYSDPFSLLAYHTFGWGLTHELGHSFDNNMGANGRTITEVTNNMWSIYDHVHLRNDSWDRPQLSVIQQELAPDVKPVMSHFEHHYGTGYIFWWQIESVYAGFWGAVENLYRFRDVKADLDAAGVTDEEAKLLTQEERHAYLCSLAAQTDLGYYFDRWGFYFSSKENAFDSVKTSEAYRKLMEKAAEGAFPREAKKFWYADYANYNYLAEGGEGMYDESMTLSIRDVRASESGILIVLPEQTKAAHLGYEILEHGKVIGFTASQAFTDTTKYASSYTPSYTVRAYDRLLNATKESAPVSPAAYAERTVARTGGKDYPSLAAAVAAAQEGDTVTLVADAATACVTFDKSLTVECEGEITLTRGETGDLLRVAEGKKLTLRGSADGTGALILDGGAFSQKGSLLCPGVSATLEVENVVFCNNFTTGDGGGIDATARGVNLYIRHSVFRHNRAIRGGAIANLAGNVIRELTDCTVEYNSAAAGGGLYLDGAAFVNGGSFTGNVASDRGGAIAVEAGNGARALQVKTDGDGVAPKFKSNRAEKGGALYVAPNTAVTSTIATVSAASFVANAAAQGSVLYVERGEAVLPALPAETEDFVFEGWLLNGEAAEAKGAYAAGDALDCRGKASFYVSAAGETRLVPEGTEISLPAAPEVPEGMTFKGWGYGDVLYAAGETVTVTEDLPLAAVFERAAPSAAEPQEKDDGRSVALYVGIAIAAVGLIAVGAVAFAVVMRGRKKK